MGLWWRSHSETLDQCLLTEPDRPRCHSFKTVQPASEPVSAIQAIERRQSRYDLVSTLTLSLAGFDGQGCWKCFKVFFNFQPWFQDLFSGYLLIWPASRHMARAKPRTQPVSWLGLSLVPHYGTVRHFLKIAHPLVCVKTPRNKVVWFCRFLDQGQEHHD